MEELSQGGMKERCHALGIRGDNSKCKEKKPNRKGRVSYGNRRQWWILEEADGRSREGYGRLGGKRAKEARPQML